MLIHGLQKMTLLDFPGHVACTVFLGGCDFRCPFCHNYELVDGNSSPLLSSEELFSFLRKRKGLLDGVAITGGEPCLRKDLPDLIKEIRKEGFLVKLDTNGNHPDVLSRILSEQIVDYVAMDIKNSPSKYGETIGMKGVDLNPIQESISLLLNSSIEYEFRTTVVNEFHEKNDFVEIGKWIQGADRYFLQCFTDRDSVPTENLHAPSREQLQEYAEDIKPFVKEVHIRGID